MGGQQAFDGARKSIFYLDPADDKIRIVGYDVPTSDKLAHFYDERAMDPPDESMARNIMVYGVTEPIIVNKLDGIGYVVDGRQRLKAARLANKLLLKEGKKESLIRIPVLVRRGAKHDLYGVMISSNEHRRDDNLINRAEKVERLINMGRTVQEAAVAFGVTEVCICQWRKLLLLDERVKKMVRDDLISAHAASKLVNLDGDKQYETAKSLLDEAKAKGKKSTTGRNVQGATGDKPVPPKKRLINKFFELPERPKVKARHDDFWAGVMFMRGELSAEEVGLDIEAVEAKLKELKKTEKVKQKSSNPKKAKKDDNKKPKIAKKKKTSKTTPPTEAKTPS